MLRRVQVFSHATRAAEVERLQDSHRFWNDPSNPDLKKLMHWRGEGPFGDDDLWLSLGRWHYGLFEKAASWAGVTTPLEGVVDWGCGGGMNAVQLAPAAEVYYGVDINQESLRECARQVEAEDAGHFVPVLIEASEPEAAVGQIPIPCDLFFSSYAFEGLPSPAYGLRVMRIAFDLLRPGGIALVQVRYHSGPALLSMGRRKYKPTWPRNTSYAIDGFWEFCEEIGFDPMFVTLVPEQPELNETRYAYFAMVK
jgi:SAM-dependent methyltransferase